eukprot:5366112-Amphidinium_carterae.1
MTAIALCQPTKFQNQNSHVACKASESLMSGTPKAEQKTEQSKVSCHNVVTLPLNRFVYETSKISEAGPKSAQKIQ